MPTDRHADAAGPAPDNSRWWNFRRRNFSAASCETSKQREPHATNLGPTVVHVPDVETNEGCQVEMARMGDSTPQNQTMMMQHEKGRNRLERLDTMEELQMIQASTGLTPGKMSRSLFNEDDDSSYGSGCSLSSVQDFDGDGLSSQEKECLLLDEKPTAIIDSKPEKVEFDVSAYMDGREMTTLQEKWNAITVVPNPVFCLYFLLAGKWLSEEAIELARGAMANADEADLFAAGRFSGDRWLGSLNHEHITFANLAEGAFTNESGCINSSMFPDLHALPPLPVVAVAIGIILHAPFSFLYHWRYACCLPPGFARIDHWSRRLDHAFIHVISGCMSYGTSGSWDYFLANLMFNADCIYRQFKPRVRPRMNKIRILISIIAYTIPILRRGDTVLFTELWIIFAACGWLFGKYPIGGWSHSAFHIVVAFAPPLLMAAACHLLASKEQIEIAARCAVLAGK